MISARLKELREQRNMTKKAVAELLNITPEGYGHYESGKRAPNHSIVEALANFYNVSVDFIYGRTDNPAPPNEKAPAIDDEGLKFALFGDMEVDDDILEDVKTYARIKREMDKQKGMDKDAKR